MRDELSASYADLLDGTYDCVDRIVLNAYAPICASPGGFRYWWRRLRGGSDQELDTAHLMRLAGRFSRRLRAFAKARGIPVIDCLKGERKHEIAEEYLRQHPEARGLFLILVARAVAPVWEVQRSKKGVLRNLERKTAYVNHYSFHSMDPDWGHLTVKMSGHPPFGAQVMLNGHEYVASQGAKQGLVFTKEGNCFTQVEAIAELARVADTLSEPRAVGHLSQLCDRWIYTACLCFALDLEEQERSGFQSAYSVYQAEYSRNLLFKVGGQLEQVFQDLVDRNRRRLDLRALRTIFGAKQRPLRRSTGRRAPRLEIAVETPTYDLTVFKLHFGKLTLKAYTKGERVLRFEAIVHNSKELRCGRGVAKFPTMVARLSSMLEAFLRTLHWLDAAFIADDTLDQLPEPSRVGKTRIGGVDVGKARMRAVMAGMVSLAPAPQGFTAGELAAKVRAMTGQSELHYGTRRAAYDLKKLRAKNLIVKPGASRRYQVVPHGLRAISALFILRDKVLKPLLAVASTPIAGYQHRRRSSLDEHYQALRIAMQDLFHELHLVAA